MKQKLYIVILCLFIAGKLFAYSGGSGTAGDPYEIATAADLVALSQTSADWDKNFIQTADIDASSISGWDPIGYYWNYPSFSGVYDGDGHVIDGLVVNTPHDEYVGLFAYITGTVKNLGVTNAEASGTGNNKIGILVGRCDGTIQNVYTTGTVTGETSTYTYGGGISGYLSQGSISNSYTTATVATNCSGGLIGGFYSSNMSNCYAIGSVTGVTYMGGLVAYAGSGNTATASYWNTETTGQSSVIGGGIYPAGVSGLTTAQMKDQASYSGWDFSSTWHINGVHNSGYPYLAWQFPAATVYANSATGSDAIGDGSSANPYQSFHKAYTMASSGDIIDLTGTFDWTNGTGEDGDAVGTGYTVNKYLTIKGQGVDLTFIQAHNAEQTADRRVFTLASGISVTMEDLCIRYGTANTSSYKDGGGIHSSAILALTNCTVTRNSAGYGEEMGTTGGKGGGIYSNAAALSLIGCTVSSNSAMFEYVEMGYTEYAGSGGGICNYHGSLEITSSTISDNTAANQGVGILNDGSNGNASLILSNSTISGNTGDWVNGAGLYSSGYYGSASAVVTNCTFTGNVANGSGGGIQTEAYQGTGSLTVTNCTFAGNTASSYNTYTGGGAIFNNSCDLYIKNSILGNNSGYDYATNGGTLHDNGYNIVETSNAVTWSGTGTITGEQADLFGSGVATTPSLADNDTQNGTQTLALGAGSVAVNAGDAAANNGVSVPTEDQRAVARQAATDIGAYEYIAAPATIYANSATGSDAAGDGSEANPYQSFHKAYTMAIDDDTIILTGTFDWTNGTGEDGDYAQHGYPIEKRLTIRGQGMDNTFIQVDASLDMATVDRRVFSIYDVSGTVTMEDLSIRYGGYSQGGGIYIDSEEGDPSLLLNRVKISDCIANEGGGIYVRYYSSLQLNNSEISGCEALENDYAGGGIYMDESVVVITNSSISANSAPDGAGGGIVVLGPSSVTLTETTVHGNSAKNCAGIYAYESDDESSFITLTGCTISGNTASEYFGGMGAEYCDNVTISNSTISENSASYIGALIFTNCDNVIIKNSTIANNQENNAAFTGGFLLMYSTVSLMNTILTNNTSGGVANDYFYYETNTLTDNGYNVVGVSNVAANADGGFNNATSILYNTKYNDAGTEYASWTQGGVELANQNLSLAAAVADNGGPTQTLVLASGSFAAGSSSTGIPYGSEPYWNNSPATDQRGTDRSSGQNTSIGAYSANFTQLLTWTGATSHDWATAANWDQNTVPTANDDVIIANVDPFPAIDDATGASCNSLTVNSGATLTINSGGSLITNGVITNNGTINVERIISEDVWHLISSPITAATASLFEGDYLQYWTESTAAWTDVTETSYELTPAMGYGLWGIAKGNHTYTFSGTPNNGDQSLAITDVGSGGSYNGANLLGNPYPSSIDWSGLDDTYGAVYYWNGSAYVSWNAGSGDGSQYIPPMKGFFIIADGSGTFSVSNSDRTHSGATRYYKSASTVEQGLVLYADNGNYRDALWIQQREEASAGFDYHSDALKFMSNTPGLAQLWSVCPDGNLSIDTRPWQETIPLGFVNDQAGFYSIGISEIADITTATLEDTKEDLFHDLTKEAYGFAWETTDDEGRFILHLGVTGIEQVAQPEKLLMYASGHDIYLKPMQSTASGTFTLTDMSGRRIVQKDLHLEGQTSVSVNATPGIYLASFTSEGSIVVKKVVIN